VTDASPEVPTQRSHEPTNDWCCRDEKEQQRERDSLCTRIQEAKKAWLAMRRGERGEQEREQERASFGCYSSSSSSSKAIQKSSACISYDLSDAALVWSLATACSCKEQQLPRDQTRNLSVRKSLWTTKALLVTAAAERSRIALRYFECEGNLLALTKDCWRRGRERELTTTFAVLEHQFEASRPRRRV